MTTYRVMGRSGPIGRGLDLGPARDLAAVAGGLRVEIDEVECPDCGTLWPIFSGDPCPGCGLAEEDVEAAADFWASLDPGPL